MTSFSMKNFLETLFGPKKPEPTPVLGDFWDVTAVSDSGVMTSPTRHGFLFEADGLDGSLFTTEQLNALHMDWRVALRLLPGEELQIVFRKRVEFADWVEDQLQQSFMADSPYGRRILLDRLSAQVDEMGKDQPRLLSQKILICFWSQGLLEPEEIDDKRALIFSQLSSFGFQIHTLDKADLEREISVSAQSLNSSELQQPEWPNLKIEVDRLEVNDNIFRSVELTQLPETHSELGMIQTLTSLPYPMDICLRLVARDVRPIVTRLERKRNLLNAKRSRKNSPDQSAESQLDQIDQVLRSLADSSEAVLNMKLTVGIRFPKKLSSFLSKALGVILRSGSQMDFCDFEESTLSTFDAYLECIPGFKGKNLKSHTVLGSNAIHFLPFFRPSKGDKKPVAYFQTRNSSLYGVDPVAPHLANYNWLVSGTSGAGKSFFVNSLLEQSLILNPNIFIVDIGGSYNKLTQFLGGQVMSLETDQGFEFSPFFLAKSDNANEERMRRQHTLQIFLEMIRTDGDLPPIAIRHLLAEHLEKLFERDSLPEHPISYLISEISAQKTKDAEVLAMLLKPWSINSFYGQFLDNNKVAQNNDRILTFDLKGLNDFEDLARVVQLIVCASLWARIRQAGKDRFSWVVLDEVAFSLLKTQPEFVDELISTIRKYYGGAIVVVQDLEKVTSNLAGSSILQNTQSKAILQQRGNPKNYADVLSLNQVDLWTIDSLRREKGSFSDIFLIRDDDKTVIRYVPSALEYWLATSAPEDSRTLKQWMSQKPKGSFQENLIDFVSFKTRGIQ